MLDERRLLAVAKTARQPHRYGLVVGLVSCSAVVAGVTTSGAGGGSSADAVVWWSSLPVIESLNSRMPRPSCLPISGSRFGPNTSRTTSSRMSNSGNPIQPGTKSRIARFQPAASGDSDDVHKKPLSEQVVVVTGASSGLGRAIARGAAAAGAKLVVTAPQPQAPHMPSPARAKLLAPRRNPKRPDVLSREIEAFGSEALVCPADHAVQDEVGQVVEP